MILIVIDLLLWSRLLEFEIRNHLNDVIHRLLKFLSHSLKLVQIIVGSTGINHWGAVCTLLLDEGIEPLGGLVIVHAYSRNNSAERIDLISEDAVSQHNTAVYLNSLIQNLVTDEARYGQVKTATNSSPSGLP